MRRRITNFMRNNVLGMIAIFIAIGGTATAGSTQNTVRSKDIVNGSVKTVDLAPNAVKSTKVAPNAITGADVKEESLDFSFEEEDEFLEPEEEYLEEEYVDPASEPLERRPGR